MSRHYGNTCNLLSPWLNRANKKYYTLIKAPNFEGSVPIANATDYRSRYTTINNWTDNTQALMQIRTASMSGMMAFTNMAW